MVGCMEVFTKLIDLGADPEIKNKDELSVIDLIILEGKSVHKQYLLRHLKYASHFTKEAF
jgi:hypothetical protein